MKYLYVIGFVIVVGILAWWGARISGKGRW
jgi:hypothetical protein